MKGKWVSALIALALLVGVRPAALYAADSDIVISEVMYDTLTGLTDTEERSYEWVEIYNKGATAVNIQDWRICDSPLTDNCDTITTSSALIGPGEYWIIANYESGFTTELNNEGYGGSYNASLTIYLGSAGTPNSIGSDGLSNIADAVYLQNSSGSATDCISWRSTALTRCSSLVYVSGGSGVDSTFDKASSGQSVTNIQGAWGYHFDPFGAEGPASPYGRNTNAGGTTAITLRALSARAPLSPAAVALPVLGLAAVAGAVVARRRRKA